MNKTWKLLSGTLFVVALLIGTLTFFGQASAQSMKNPDASFDFIDGQLVVSVEEESNIQSMQRNNDAVRDSPQLEKSGFQVIDSLLSDDKDAVQAMNNDFKKSVVDHMGMVYLIEYSEAQYKSVDEAKVELEKSLEDMGLKVRYMQGNYNMHALEQAIVETSPTDVHPEQEWHYDMINAPKAWETTPGSNSTKIAVLDTGIDSTHQNLSDYVDTEAGKSFVGGNTEDVQGHGTHVAGTISSYGDVSGVMQEATLIPVKVLDDNGSGSMFGIQEGIIYAASVDADVINMSLGGGGYDQGMDEAIDMANADGTIVVAASGNDGTGNVSYPAAYDGAIAVGSVDSSGTRSDFSNYGAELDVMAPGEGIYSTVPSDGYDTLSGTSMATPHVAGVMGLIRATDPEISVEDARSLLMETAQGTGTENEYGYGIVDADAAVQQVGNGDGGEDPENPTAPEWEVGMYYYYGDVVSYGGEEYICEYSHYAYSGWEPPYSPGYWSAQ